MMVPSLSASKGKLAFIGLSTVVCLGSIIIGSLALAHFEQLKNLNSVWSGCLIGAPVFCLGICIYRYWKTRQAASESASTALTRTDSESATRTDSASATRTDSASATRTDPESATRTDPESATRTDPESATRTDSASAQSEASSTRLRTLDEIRFLTRKTVSGPGSVSEARAEASSSRAHPLEGFIFLTRADTTKKQSKLTPKSRVNVVVNTIDKRHKNVMHLIIETRLEDVIQLIYDNDYYCKIMISVDREDLGSKEASPRVEVLYLIKRDENCFEISANCQSLSPKKQIMLLSNENNELTSITTL